MTEADAVARGPVPTPTKSRLFYLLRHLDVARGRTVRLVEQVPADRLEWAPAPGLPTIADRVRHIAASGRYVYVQTALGQKPAYPGHGADLCYGREGLLAYLETSHRDSMGQLRGLMEHDLDRFVELAGGADVPVWRWLQMMVEEEAEARGQIELLLTMAGADSPRLARTA